MTERSNRWPAVRAAFLKDHGTCCACGQTDHLQVHHIVPFYKDKTLELEPSNLITLCEDPGWNCHFTWGHLHDWYGFNPNVKREAAHYLDLISKRQY